MHRIQNAVLAALATALVSPAIAAPALPATQPLHLTKECNEYTGDTPSFCMVTDSNIAAIPKGTKIWYWGPDLGVADPMMTASSVIIDAGVGNMAAGYCIVDQTDPAHQVGMCAFTAGSGTLAGFSALIEVTQDGSTYHWDGPYWTAGK
jgi:hypothetical protein